MQVLLVTIDPEVDTAEHLASTSRASTPASWVSPERPPTSTASRALFVAKHDRSHPVTPSTTHHASKTFTDRIEIYSHSQQVYLLDMAGRTRGMFFSGSPLEEMESAVRSLLSEAAARPGRVQERLGETPDRAHDLTTTTPKGPTSDSSSICSPDCHVVPLHGCGARRQAFESEGPAAREAGARAASLRSRALAEGRGRAEDRGGAARGRRAQARDRQRRHDDQRDDVHGQRARPADRGARGRLRRTHAGQSRQPEDRLPGDPSPGRAGPATS